MVEWPGSSCRLARPGDASFRGQAPLLSRPSSAFFILASCSLLLPNVNPRLYFVAIAAVIPGPFLRLLFLAATRRRARSQRCFPQPIHPRADRAATLRPRSEASLVVSHTPAIPSPSSSTLIPSTSDRCPPRLPLGVVLSYQVSLPLLLDAPSRLPLPELWDPSATVERERANIGIACPRLAHG